MIEDVSLCFKALKDLPGPYIKWFVQDLKLDGLTKILSAYEDKRAVAKVIFAYGERDKDGKPTEPSRSSAILSDSRSLSIRLELFIGTAEGKSGCLLHKTFASLSPGTIVMPRPEKHSDDDG